MLGPARRLSRALGGAGDEHRELTGVRGLLVVLACAVLVVWPERSSVLGVELGRSVQWGAVLSLAAAAAVIGLRRRIGASLGTAAVVAWLALELYTALDSPMRGLFAMLATIAVVTWMWPPRHRRVHVRSPLLVPALVSLAVALHVATVGARVGLSAGIGLSAMFFVTPAMSLLRARGRGIAPKLALAVGIVPVADVWLSAAGIMPDVSFVGLLSPLLALVSPLVAFRDRDAARRSALIDLLFSSPSRVLVLSFLGLCVLGTICLSLPVATEHEISWIDAAFTATSAVCVTGLIVLDTPVAFSWVGEGVLLLLIQLGGLGIMSLSAAAFVILGRRLPLSYEPTAADVVGAKGLAGVGPAIKLILQTTFIVEGVSCSLLFVAFVLRGDAWAHAAWRAAFTAISAFCNAGFALQSDSLIPYAEDPFVLGVVGLTIMAGGLGPIVLLAAWRYAERRNLQVRIALWASVILWVVPAVFFALIEWEHALGGLAPLDRISNAVFQSVTLRTAGFNSVDISELRPATWTIMMVAMFIGGCPGSTAGGVKTTTFAVFVLLVVSVVRREPHVRVLGRRVDAQSVRRGAATIAIAAGGAFMALLIIQLTQSIDLDVAAFEVVSALATVGLSLGGTGELDVVGKVVIMLCMFMGRVGPVTLFTFFTRSRPGRRGATLPKEAVATA